MAVIGIDLGTSNSSVAVLRGGRPVLIPGAEGISLGRIVAGIILVPLQGLLLLADVAVQPKRSDLALGRALIELAVHYQTTVVLEPIQYQSTAVPREVDLVN